MRSKSPNVYSSNSVIKRNVQYQILQWHCLGIAGKKCSNILNNGRSSKPRQRCDECQREHKLERMRANYRERKLKRFLKGNV